jgi:hypothetical protein
MRPFGTYYCFRNGALLLYFMAKITYEKSDAYNLELNENATLEIIFPNCVVLVEEVIVDHPPISCRLIYYLFCPKDY